MAADARIGRRYAQALFSVARQHGMVRGVEDDLNAIVRLYREDINFHELLTLPQSSREEKVRRIEALFADRATAVTLQVLRVMLEKGREAQIPAVRDEFVRLRRADENVVFAEVESAAPLDPEQKEALIAKLAATLGRQVEASFSVQPALLGGVRVEYDNFVLDGTARGALQRMRERLRTDLLKQA